MAGRDDFYVGYRREAPQELARTLRLVVALLLLLGGVLAAALATLQNPFDPGVFEFGVVRSFEGVLVERPHPLLLVARPGAAGGTVSRFYLVAEGKHGAGAETAGLDGYRVRLDGTLIHRQGQTMIEVARGSVEPLGAAPGGAGGAGGAFVDLGSRTLSGEIVDSKCFLGVMKPGRGKPHRACATRCISGGIPPILRVVTADGEERHFLLTDQDGGGVNERVLDRIAEPVEVTGRVLRSGDLLILRADPARIRRLSDRAAGTGG